MNIYTKLNEAREKFHSLELKKTGHNKFANYYYFELGDFLIPALRVFKEVGLCAVVSFDKDFARMTIIDANLPLVDLAGLVDEKGVISWPNAIVITSPMGSAQLKGCHEVQNIGAVETYQRRYLWVAALEIVEHDALDATTGQKSADAKPRQPLPEGITTGSGPKQSYDSLTPDWKSYVDELATYCENLMEQSGPAAVQAHLDNENLEPNLHAALWHRIHPDTRKAVDKITKGKVAE